VTGPGATGRPGPDADDGDITGPRGGDIAPCQERLQLMARWRLARIQRLVRPTDEQRGAFDELRMAAGKALDIMRAACPAERPLTPPGRMAAAEKWLEARLQAIKVMRPALDNFYRLLTDEQKVRWSLGVRLGRDADHMRWFDRPGGPDEWRERRRERYQRERDAGPPERRDRRFEDERTRRPPERWGDDARRDWRDERRRPQPYGRDDDDTGEERL
jgi:hypothetical protein